MSAGSGTKAVVAALLANAGIAAAKFAGFAITGSAAMLAEGAHSIADTGNQGLLLLGMKRGGRDPDARRPFGYGPERYFWAFVVAMILFSLGALFSLYEGIEKLRHPHPLESPLVAVGILLAAILLEGFSFRTAIKESRQVKGSLSWWGFIHTSRHAELPVVLLEDAGALIGLALALTGVALAMITHNGIFDAIGTLAIAALLGAIAVVLAAEMKSLLIGERASETDEEKISGAIESVEAIEHLIHLRTLHLGPDEILVAAKIDLREELSFVEVAESINLAEERIREALPAAEIIYLEPDLYSPKS
ncbi:MAG: cation transporter [Acidobacteria bacterium]|nr:MAG: cation transporter [Acidobacteriota bacterium]